MSKPEVELGYLIEFLDSNIVPIAEATLYDAAGVAEDVATLGKILRESAAAPELVEALRHMITEWRLHGQCTDSCRVGEAALRKAGALD